MATAQNPHETELSEATILYLVDFFQGIKFHYALQLKLAYFPLDKLPAVGSEGTVEIVLNRVGQCLKVEVLSKSTSPKADTATLRAFEKQICGLLPDNLDRLTISANYADEMLPALPLRWQRNIPSSKKNDSNQDAEKYAIEDPTHPSWTAVLRKLAEQEEKDQQKQELSREKLKAELLEKEKENALIESQRQQEQKEALNQAALAVADLLLSAKTLVIISSFKNSPETTLECESILKEVGIKLIPNKDVPSGTHVLSVRTKKVKGHSTVRIELGFLKKSEKSVGTDGNALIPNGSFGTCYAWDSPFKIQESDGQKNEIVIAAVKELIELVKETRRTGICPTVPLR